MISVSSDKDALIFTEREFYLFFHSVPQLVAITELTSVPVGFSSAA